MAHRPWIKVWCLPWTEGRIREAPLAVRGTFITLCCLVGDKDAEDGFLRVTPEIGYTDNQIAGMLHCDVRTWAEHAAYLQDCQKDGKPDPLIAVHPGNVIEIIGWRRFQPPYMVNKDAPSRHRNRTPIRTTPRRSRSRSRRSKDCSSKEDLANSQLGTESLTDDQSQGPTDPIETARTSRNPIEALIGGLARAKSVGRVLDAEAGLKETT